jgi:hypothetical protein
MANMASELSPTLNKTRTTCSGHCDKGGSMSIDDAMQQIASTRLRSTGIKSHFAATK